MVREGGRRDEDDSDGGAAGERQPRPHLRRHRGAEDARTAEVVHVHRARVGRVADGRDAREPDGRVAKVACGQEDVVVVGHERAALQVLVMPRVEQVEQRRGVRVARRDARAILTRDDAASPRVGLDVGVLRDEHKLHLDALRPARLTGRVVGIAVQRGHLVGHLGRVVGHRLRVAAHGDHRLVPLKVVDDQRLDVLLGGAVDGEPPAALAARRLVL